MALPNEIKVPPTVIFDQKRKKKKKRKNDKAGLRLLSYRCIVAVNVLWLFLTVPWVGLQCVIMVIPDHTHLIFDRAIYESSGVF